MDNRRGGLFLYSLGTFSLLWGIIAFYLIYRSSGREGALAFSRVYFFTCLDLIALIVLFWKLFFSQAAKTAKKIDLFLWFSFKLVCLAFLAITLKRLNNAPFAAILLGVGFIGVGPIVAGVVCKAIARDNI
jgi:hypothetical protein